MTDNKNSNIEEQIDEVINLQLENKEIKECTIGFSNIKKPIQLPYNKTYYDEILVIGNLRGVFGEWKPQLYEYEGKLFPGFDYSEPQWSLEGRDNLYWLRMCMEEGCHVTIIENLRPSDSLEDTYYDRLKAYMLHGLNTKKIFECLFTHIKVVTDERGKFDINEYLNPNVKKRYDLCIMNAPYTLGLYEKLGSRAIDIVKEEVIWIGPLTWLLGKKRNKELCRKCDQYHTNIETIDPKDHFDSNIDLKMGIIRVNKKKQKMITYNDIGYDFCGDILHFGDDLLMMSAYKKIKPYMFTDNVNSHILSITYNEHRLFGNSKVRKPKNNEYVFRIPKIQGGANRPYFYSIISKKHGVDDVSGKYKDLKDKKNKMREPLVLFYIPLENKKQCKNFYKFARTDFGQLCLYFIKINSNLHAGEMKYLPWLDWNEEWDDVKLFKMFNLNKKEIERIYEVIPNYFSNDRKKVLRKLKKLNKGIW